MGAKRKNSRGRTGPGAAGARPVAGRGVAWLLAAAFAAVPAEGQDPPTAADSAAARDTAGAAVQPEPPAEPTVREVAEAYLDLLSQGRWDEAAAYYAPDIFFMDPTASVFDPSLAGGLEGPEAVVAFQRSRGIQTRRQEVVRSFTSGEFAVFFGPLSVVYESGGPAGPFPFVTLLRIRDGRILERIDYGDYVEYTERLDRGQLGAGGRALLRNARAYMDAYGEQRFEDWRPLLGGGPVYQNPTLMGLGEASDAPRLGADAIVGGFEAASGWVTDFRLSVEEAFYTPGNAVFLSSVRGEVSVAAFGGSGAPDVQVRTPMVTVLQFEDGRVVGHQDYLDATELAAAAAAVRATAEPGPG